MSERCAVTPPPYDLSEIRLDTTVRADTSTRTNYKTESTNRVYKQQTQESVLCGGA